MTNPSAASPPLADTGFLASGGEMGALMRAHDWSASPLGAPGGWPASLRAVVALMLNSRYPMFVAWGPQLAFLYNDGYVPIFGKKHPHTLGLPFQQVWAEIWDDIAPLVASALAGEATYHENLHLVMQRNGFPEDTWYSFSYSPVRDEAGLVAGMFCACTETTQSVHAQRRRDALLELDGRLRDVSDAAELSFAASELLGRALGVARVGYGTFDAVADTVTVQRNWSAPGFTSVAGVHHFSDYGDYAADLRRGNAVANADVDADPRTAANASAFAALGIRAFLDMPVLEQGVTVAQLFVHSATPRNWTPEEIAFVRDVAERTRTAIARREAEAELRESAARLAAALAISGLGTFEWDLHTDTVALDDRARAIFGFPPGTGGTATEVFARIDPADFDRVHAEAMASRQALSPLQVDYRIVLPGGAVRVVASMHSPVARAGGQAARLVGVFEDVTDRHRAEAGRLALVELGEAVRNIDGAAELAFAAARVLGQALAASRAGYARIDHDRETLQVERDWAAPGVATLAGELALRGDGAFVDDLKRGETVAMADVRNDARSAAGGPEGRGTRAFVQVPVVHDGRLAALLFVETGQPRDWHADEIELVRQFAERTHAAVERIRNAAKLRALNADLERRVIERTQARGRSWAVSPDLMGALNAEGRFTTSNPAWQTVLGWSEDDVRRTPIWHLIHPDDLERTRASFARTQGGQPAIGFANRYRCRDGTYRWLSWVGVAEDGMVYCTGRDITDDKAREAELQAAQEALRQSQKMEAVGQLTGGLAHDFNNLLAAMSGSLELIRARMAQGRTAETAKYVTAALAAASRAAALTHRLLAFSRRQTLAPKPTDVKQLVAGMEELIGRTIGPDIQLETVNATGLWPSLIDPSQLENAVLNLCINARDAMPDGGRITIATANRRLDRRLAAEHGVEPGQYIALGVSDTGTGMTPDVIAKAFDPFFTTKPIGAGTGLGLSMIYGFARQSGGAVTIDSQPGQGTTVRIYLPRHVGAAPPAAAAPELAGAPLGALGRSGETVLVVDDEPTVRMLIGEVLADLGYTAIEAADGAAALRVLNSDARVDLLVSDVGLPGGINGRQVADAARTLRPGLQVLFITGYAETAVLSHGHLEPGMHVMTKPFAMDALASRIRELIASDGVPAGPVHR